MWRAAFIILAFLLAGFVKFSSDINRLSRAVNHRFFPADYIIVKLPENYQGHFLFYLSAEKENLPTEVTLPESGITRVSEKNFDLISKSSQAAWIDFESPSGQKIKSSYVTRWSRNTLWFWGEAVLANYGTLGPGATPYFELEPAYQEARIRNLPLKEVAPLWPRLSHRESLFVYFKSEEAVGKFFVVESPNTEPCITSEARPNLIITINKRGYGKIDCALHPLQLNFSKRFHVNHTPGWNDRTPGLMVLPLAYDMQKDSTYYYYWIKNKEYIENQTPISFGKSLDPEVFKKASYTFKNSNKTVSEILSPQGP